MADWDANSPEDGDIVSQYPANERAARQAVADNFNVDHHAQDDADIGKHEAIQLLDQAGDPTIDADDVGLWNNGGVLKTRAGTGDPAPVDAFPSGTKMVFYQAAAPAGWTQDTSVNDRVLNVVNTAGGGTGGSWTISGITTQNHSLTVAQMPTHNHGGNTSNTTISGSFELRRDSDSGTIAFAASGGFTILDSGGGSSSRVSITGSNLSRTRVFFSQPHTHPISSQGSGSGHNHGVSHNGNWRPSHIDVIVAEKD